MIMISLIHHSGRVKSVMVFIFGCLVIPEPETETETEPEPEPKK